MKSEHTRPVAIVTGASSGIGEASAMALARAGHAVVLVARRGDLLEDLAKRIERTGGQAMALPADLAEEAATESVVSEAARRFGRIDVLFNNAGYSPAAALEQLSRERLRHVFEVNLLSGLHLIGLVAPVMRGQGSGRIINMGSMAASVPAPLAVPYSATKGGIESATDCLRLELERFGIRVSIILPGFVDTPTFDNSRAMGQRLREDETNPYRQTMFDLDDFARSQLKSAIPPEAVAEQVVRAATDAKPNTRYYAPAGSRLPRALLSAMPDRLADWILLRTYGVSY